MNEFSFIEYLRKRVPHSFKVAVGIGDDAAVLKKLGSGNLVVSTDMLVEDVDFVLNKLGPEKIGRKALAVNLSDLAAMGAEPVAFVLTIGKPKHVSTRWLERFYDGLLKLAKQYKVDCIGGDFSGAKEFSVSVTILGKARRVVSRSGAKAGDWIGVTGSLGGSILKHHYDFTPRIREGLFLAGNCFANAIIDISDGLVQDLSHLLEASRAGAVLELDKIPVSADALRMERRDRSKHAKQTCPSRQALEQALSDGEDFELLFTAPPRKKILLEKSWRRKFPKVSLAWIGRIEGKKPLIRWVLKGKVIPAPKLSKQGFTHF